MSTDEALISYPPQYLESGRTFLSCWTPTEQARLARWLGGLSLVSLGALRDAIEHNEFPAGRE